MKNLNAKLNNEIIHRVLPAQEQMDYYYFVPKKVSQVLVLVHGISRNAEEIIHAFQPLAQEHGLLLIAPVFSKSFAKDYQRLGRLNKGPRSDYQLLAIINDCQQQSRQRFEKFHLFGFSAGAQFAHRFAFAHPNSILKVALVAPGWYTLPNTNLNYPLGLKLNQEFTDISFIYKRFLRVKYKVFIGSNDNLRDPALNKNSNIDKAQGTNRIERAEKWISLMHKKFLTYDIDNHIDLELLADANHDFNNCDNQANLVEKTIQWLLHE